MKSLLSHPRQFVALLISVIIAGACLPIHPASADTVEDVHTSQTVIPDCVDGQVVLDLVINNNDSADPSNLMLMSAQDDQTQHGLTTGSLGPVAGQTPAFGQIVTLLPAVNNGSVQISRIYIDGHDTMDAVSVPYRGRDCANPTSAPLQVSATATSRCLPNLGLYGLNSTVTNQSTVPVKLVFTSLSGVVLRWIGVGESLSRYSFVSGYSVRSTFRVFVVARDGRGLRAVGQINPPLQGDCRKVRNSH